MPVSDPDVSRPRLVRDATFLEADRREIALRRGPHNRLGFAYQVAFVRVLGRFPQQMPLEIRVPLPAETLNSKLASLPEGVTVERDRIEVRFSGAKNATERLYALAFALVNDYERFEALVDRGVGGGGEAVKR